MTETAVSPSFMMKEHPTFSCPHGSQVKDHIPLPLLQLGVAFGLNSADQIPAEMSYGSFQAPSLKKQKYISPLHSLLYCSSVLLPGACALTSWTHEVEEA